jgi:hypothetical protein
MEQKQAIVESKPVRAVFKPQADLSFLGEILTAAAEKRFILLGMQQTHVEQCMQAYLADIFSKPSTYKKIEKVLLSAVSGTPIKVTDFISSSLLPEFSNYLLQYTDVDIDACLDKEIASAAKQRGCHLLTTQFESYKQQGLVLLRKYAINDSAEAQLVKKWHAKIHQARDKTSFLEKLPEPSNPNLFVLFTFILALPLYTKYILRSITDMHATFLFPEDEIEEAKAKEILNKDQDLQLLLLQIFGVTAFLLIAVLVAKKLNITLFNSDKARFDDLLQKVSARYTTEHPPVDPPSYLMASIIAVRDRRSSIPDEPPKLPKAPKRWQLPSLPQVLGFGSRTLPSSDDEKKQPTPAKVVRTSTTTYTQLTRNGIGTTTFFSYNHKDPRLAKIPAAYKGLDIIGRHPTIYPPDHEGQGLKQVGEGERNYGDCPYKIKFFGEHRSTRLGVAARSPTAEEREILGVLDSDTATILHIDPAVQVRK